MEALQTHPPIDRNTIFADLVDMLEEITSDWDTEFTGEIAPSTRLVADLAFESIDIVMLIVAVEGHFSRQGLPFEDLLMVDGRYVNDLPVSQVVDFLYDHLNG